MKNHYVKILLVLLSFATVAHAFPPAPYHLLYGMVRDEYGNPIISDQAEVILETSSGVKLVTKLDGALEPGTNYRLAIPMDAGITSDLYKPTALRPTVPFKIKVKIGNTTFLPMEMVADFALLGQPGQRTRLNLTLGVDADGDGIPDAWERALIDLLGGGKNLTDINPADDADGDGLSNLDEYLAGSYAFDDKNGFVLDIVRINAGAPVLEFTAVRGRNYTVEASTDLQTWRPVSFRLPNSTAALDIYRAQDIRLLQIELLTSAEEAAPNFYRLMLR